jgi:hypothetical protein
MVVGAQAWLTLVTNLAPAARMGAAARAAVATTIPSAVPMRRAPWLQQAVKRMMEQPLLLPQTRRQRPHSTQ